MILSQEFFQIIYKRKYFFRRRINISLVNPIKSGRKEFTFSIIFIVVLAKKKKFQYENSADQRFYTLPLTYKDST